MQLPKIIEVKRDIYDYAVMVAQYRAVVQPSTDEIPTVDDDII